MKRSILVLTSVALAGGFCVLMLSEFLAFVYLGLLVGVTLLLWGVSKVMAASNDDD